MLKTTNCDALMIGRGSVINPFIFHQIKAAFSNIPYIPSWDALDHYLDLYLAELNPPARMQVNKLKQLLGFLFRSNEELLAKRLDMLKQSDLEPHDFLKAAKEQLRTHWR